MTAMWDKLIVLLNQTLEIYQALLKLSRQKRELLIAAKPQELEQLTKQEEVLIIEVGKLEAMRLVLTRQLVEAIDMTSSETDLSSLIERADEQTAAKLRELSDRFNQVTGELVEYNKLNTRLIQQSLEFINFNINILSQNAVGPTYAAKGQAAPAGPSRSILDARA